MGNPGCQWGLCSRAGDNGSGAVRVRWGASTAHPSWRFVRQARGQEKQTPVHPPSISHGYLERDRQQRAWAETPHPQCLAPAQPRACSTAGAAPSCASAGAQRPWHRHITCLSVCPVQYTATPRILCNTERGLIQMMIWRSAACAHGTEKPSSSGHELLVTAGG